MLPDELKVQAETKIVFLILDGVGGIPIADGKGTELEEAHTPNLDQLASESSCGLMDPVAPGITPGSGPAHFSLFGYDPVSNIIGRGVLAATGIGFEMKDSDVAARINFATVDSKGKVVDRRAGRISTEENTRLCEKLSKEVNLGTGVEFFIRPVKEHRAALVLRGQGLSGDVSDTDPEKTGLAPLEPTPIKPEAAVTAGLIGSFAKQAAGVLADEPKANMVLVRGVAAYRRYPSMMERFGLRARSIAGYPMYKGITRLLGMDVVSTTGEIADEVHCLSSHWEEYDFFYVHVKQTDSRGEDGDCQGKIKVIEEVDRHVPQIRSMKPDVLVVTGDHSTPCTLKAHSWHPVPVILWSPNARVDAVSRFSETECAAGCLGRFLSLHLMSEAMAHAGRLRKFGA